MHVTVTHLGKEMVFTFAKDVIYLGRSNDCDVVLRSDMVSRRHIKLTARRMEREVLVEDHKSTCGTFVGHRRVGVAGQIIGADDVITLGSEFVIRARTDLLILDPAAEKIEKTFLATLMASPRDDVTRAVYADWLEERGRLAQAHFLRAQLVARDVGEPTDPAFANASKTLVALTDKVSAAWRARVAMTFVEPATCPRRPGNTSTHDGNVLDQAVVGFDLECPKRWDEMKPTMFDGIRHCNVCDQDVTYCSTIAEAQMHARYGGCIAVDIGVARKPGDLIDESRMVRGRPAPPLISRGEPPPPMPPMPPLRKRSN